jgi:hypothetical protein
MSGIGRVFSQLGEDNRSFLQALRDLPETVSSSREQIKAQKELRKLLKQANFGAKKGASESDIDALVTKLVGRLGKGDDAAQLKYIKDLVQKAGYGDEGLASLPRNATTHKFKPRDIPAPKIFPGIGRTFRDALSDVGYKSNASFRRVAADTQDDMIRKRFLGQIREGQLDLLIPVVIRNLPALTVLPELDFHIRSISTVQPAGHGLQLFRLIISPCPGVGCGIIFNCFDRPIFFQDRLSLSVNDPDIQFSIIATVFVHAAVFSDDTFSLEALDLFRIAEDHRLFPDIKIIIVLLHGR